MRPTKSQPFTGGLTLSDHTIKAWQKTLRQFARPPRGSNPQELSDQEFCNLIARHEAPAVLELWEAFTVNRGEVGRYLKDPKLQTIAYLLGFHLPNCARADMVLTRFSKRMGGVSFGSSPIRVWDLGCGTGAMSQAMVSWLFRKKVRRENIHVELADNKGAFLDCARFLMEQYLPEENIHCRKWELKEGVRLDVNPDETNIVVLGYVWNELLRHAKARDSLLHWFKQLSKHNALILCLEPANQSITRAAMELRDELSEQSWQALYPCPKIALCPMLERQKDWCFSEERWNKPIIMAKLDQRLEIDRSKLNTAGFVFASEGLKLEPLETAVIVGKPEKAGNQKQKELLLCTPDGLKKRQPETARGILPLRGETLPLEEEKPVKKPAARPFSSKPEAPFKPKSASKPSGKPPYPRDKAPTQKRKPHPKPGKKK